MQQEIRKMLREEPSGEGQLWRHELEREGGEGVFGENFRVKAAKQSQFLVKTCFVGCLILFFYLFDRSDAFLEQSQCERSKRKVAPPRPKRKQIWSLMRQIAS